MAAPGGRRRLIVAGIAFVLWAPAALPLAALPLAALLVLGRPATAQAWLGPGALVALSGLVFAQTGAGALGAMYQAWGVLLTAAFAAGVVLGSGSFWRHAVRATAAAALAFAVLARLSWGPRWLGWLTWDTVRQTRMVQSQFAQAFPVLLQPDIAAAGDAMARFVGATVPAVVVLQSLAGLGLAWAAHSRLRPQMTPPLGAFRDFRLADAWVWAVVAMIAGWLLGQHTLAQNLAVVLGTLYVLQGAAIVTAIAGALGVGTAALIVAGLIAVPLAVLVLPGLWTLGVTDTWLQYRRRLAARAARQDS